MKKTLATFALAAVPALVLSACNGSASGGGPGVAALPNAPVAASHRGRGHHDDNGPQDLHTGGADVPDYAYTLGTQPVGSFNQSQAGPGPGSLFFAAPTIGTIYYCLTSSTDGRKAFEGEGDSAFPPTGPCAAFGQTATGFGGRQDPLDFVGSAVALASTECCASGTPYNQGRLSGSVTWGQPFEFPQIGAAIVYGYRPQDFSSNVSNIKLSTWTYCAIANGTVSDWNDGAITADNGKSVTGGASEPITFYFRSDSAASTDNFTNHLNTACNVTWKKPYNKAPYQTLSRSAAWTFGVANSWPGPGSSGDPNANFIGETGDPGILAAIQATAFSTGYVGGAIAKAASPKVGQALLQNGTSKGAPVWVDPTVRASLVKSFKKVTAANITFGGGSDSNPLGSSTPWCQLYIPATFYVNPPKGAYPIVAVSYLLFYGKNNGVHLSDKKTLINFLESKKANNITNKLEFVPLSQSVESAVISALNGNGGSQPACLQ
jgi:ABC-type phosphate transport system substrate-binding protein